MTDPIDDAIAAREYGHLDPGAPEAEQDRVERDHWRRLGEELPDGGDFAEADIGTPPDLPPPPPTGWHGGPLGQAGGVG